MLIRNGESLGELIHDRRRNLGWSQKRLGERIGASRYWVGEVEKGKPTAEVGLVISALQALGMAIDVHSAVGVDKSQAQIENTTQSSSPAGTQERPTLTRGGKPLRASREVRRSGGADES